MAAHEYAFTLTPGSSSRTRSVALAGVAIVAVCVLSSTVVIRELVGTPTARAAIATRAVAATPATPAVIAAPAAAATPAATASPATPAAVATPATAAATSATTARNWSLESRWWQGQISQMSQVGQINQQVPPLPDSELTFTKGYQLRLAARQATQPASPPTQVVTAPTIESHSGRTATIRKPATAVARTANPFARFEAGTRALAYDEQRPRERGFVFR